MLVSTRMGAAPMLRSASTPPGPDPNPEPNPEPQTGRDVDAFYRGVGGTSDFLLKFDGAVGGGIGGFALGTVVGAAANAPGLGGIVGAGLGGVLGYKVGEFLSDLGGRIGADIDSSNPTRGDALGRLAVEIAPALIADGVRGGAGAAVVPLLGGGLNYLING